MSSHEWKELTYFLYAWLIFAAPITIVWIVSHLEEVYDWISTALKDTSVFMSCELLWYAINRPIQVPLRGIINAPPSGTQYINTPADRSATLGEKTIVQEELPFSIYNNARKTLYKTDVTKEEKSIYDPDGSLYPTSPTKTCYPDDETRPDYRVCRSIPPSEYSYSP